MPTRSTPKCLEEPSSANPRQLLGCSPCRAPGLGETEPALPSSTSSTLLVSLQGQTQQDSPDPPAPRGLCLLRPSPTRPAPVRAPARHTKDEAGLSSVRLSGRDPLHRDPPGRSRFPRAGAGGAAQGGVRSSSHPLTPPHAAATTGSKHKNKRPVHPLPPIPAPLPAPAPRAPSAPPHPDLGASLLPPEPGPGRGRTC